MSANVPAAGSFPVPASGSEVVDEGHDAGAPDAGAPEAPSRRRRGLLLLLLLVGLLLLLIGIAIWYFLFRQPLPLPVPTNVAMPGYSTSMYGMLKPLGIAVTPDGSRIYVAETEGDRLVRILDAAGNQVGIAQPPETTGTDHVPVWLALDPITSELYVSDRPTGQVYVYDGNGAYLRTLELAEKIPGWQPMGLAFDAAGNLYVADVAGEGPRIEKYDRNLALVQSFGTADGLNFPNGVGVDAKGNVFIADSNNGRLLAYRPDGTLIGQIGRGTASGKLGLPRGIAVDAKGLVYVADTTGQAVMVARLSDAGALESVGSFGAGGTRDGQFMFPNGVAADGRGRIYIADTSNDRVQLWSY